MQLPIKLLLVGARDVAVKLRTVMQKNDLFTFCFGYLYGIPVEPEWTTCCIRALGCSSSCYDMTTAGGRCGPPAESRPARPWCSRTRGTDGGRGRTEPTRSERSPLRRGCQHLLFKNQDYGQDEKRNCLFILLELFLVFFRKNISPDYSSVVKQKDQTLFITTKLNSEE